MNIQELLDSLSSLEKELNNIKSARVMAEETITSYQDTQKEIARLIDKLGQAEGTLISLVDRFSTEDNALSQKLKEATGKLDHELSNVNQGFADNCEKANAAFSASIAMTTDDLRNEISAIRDAFSTGNTSFRQHIDSLGYLQDSLKAIESGVSSIRDNTGTFQTQLDSVCEKHDKDAAAQARLGSEIYSRLGDMEAAIKAAEKNLVQIRDAIASESETGKSNYASLQKSLKNIQIWLIVVLILLLVSVCYPFLGEFLKQ